MKILALTGYSCSGKSTVARYLQNTHNFFTIAYHDTLREITKSKGYSRTREWIFDAGIKKVVEEGRQEILNKLESAILGEERLILLDGLYDINLVFLLKERFGKQNVITVAVLSDKQVRVDRTMAREKLNKHEAIEELEFIDSFKDTIGIDSVMKEADIFINNDDDIKTVYDELNYILSNNKETEFTNYLKQSAVRIDADLDTYLAQWIESIPVDFQKVRPLFESFAISCKGGKRIRSVLVKLGYEIAKGFHEDSIYSVAIAYELFQSAMLVHDDIIDESPLRRGNPTLHKVYEKRNLKDLKQNDKAPHYGISQTICIGDIALSLAIKVIADSEFKPDIKNKVTSSFIQTIVDTGLGQMLDVELPYLERSSVNEADIMTVFKYKTAHYTIIGPLQLGAMLAEASQNQLDAIAVFGNNLGIAFQIKDDVMGIFSEEKVIGKSVTSDIEEGKNTLLFSYAVKNANEEQTLFLQKYYGTGKITPDIHEHFKQLFIATGAKAYTEKVMRSFVDKALKTINSITENEVHRKQLQELTFHMIYRVK